METLGVCACMFACTCTLGASYTHFLPLHRISFIAGRWIFSVVCQGDRHFVLNLEKANVSWKVRKACLFVEITELVVEKLLAV